MIEIIFAIQTLVMIYLIYLMFRTFAVKKMLIRVLRTFDENDPYFKDKLLILLINYHFVELLLRFKSLQTIEKQIITDFEKIDNTGDTDKPKK